jgi:ABC-type Fe3+-hydroxamate transport system substrate-binding protein
MSKSVITIMLALVISIMLAVSPAIGEKVTVEDDLGRDVVISAPCERIVFMMENALKTYYAVGEPEDIVALKDDALIRCWPSFRLPLTKKHFRASSTGSWEAWEQPAGPRSIPPCL